MNPGHFANGHFAKFWTFRQMDILPTFIFPPLDKVDGVEDTYKSFISNYKSVPHEGSHLASYYIQGTLFNGKRKKLDTVLNVIYFDMLISCI